MFKEDQRAHNEDCFSFCYQSPSVTSHMHFTMVNLNPQTFSEVWRSIIIPKLVLKKEQGTSNGKIQEPTQGFWVKTLIVGCFC